MNQPQSRLTVRTATDILDVVPTLLGCVPIESLVIIYLETVSSRDRIAMTARMDLPNGPTEFAAALQIIQQHAHSHDSIMLVAYTVDAILADRTLIKVLSAMTGIEIKVAISASAEGWAEVGLDKPIVLHPYSDQTSVVTTAMVAAGLQYPHQTRDDLAGTIARPSRSELGRMADLLRQSQPLDRDHLIDWLDKWASGSPGHVLDDKDAAALVASVQDIQVRDAAWAAITCADADVHIDLWRQLVRLVDGPPALPILGLLGMAAWIGGQGALANLALDRAVETKGYSDYTLFELLQGVLRVGINPRKWDTMRRVFLGSEDVLMG